MDRKDTTPNVLLKQVDTADDWVIEAPEKPLIHNVPQPNGTRRFLRPIPPVSISLPGGPQPLSAAPRLTGRHTCEQCGKMYKHRNCLSKHRWEHHESWESTRKVCATKHQQVQLLEAAQVLIEMQLCNGLSWTVDDHATTRTAIHHRNGGHGMGQ